MSGEGSQCVSGGVAWVQVACDDAPKLVSDTHALVRAVCVRAGSFRVDFVLEIEDDVQEAVLRHCEGEGPLWWLVVCFVVEIVFVLVHGDDDDGWDVGCG